MLQFKCDIIKRKMEIHNKRKLLKAPPNLTLSVKKHHQSPKNGVSSCNLSRIADKTQRTEFKQEESILNDLGAFLNTKREEDNDDDNSDSGPEDNQDLNEYRGFDPKKQLQLQKIYEEYEKALEILTNQAEVKISPAYSYFKAYEILNNLIETIKYQRQKELKYELAENILLNYWKVGNDLFMADNTNQSEGHSKPKHKKQSVEQKQRQRIVDSFRDVFTVLEDMLLKQQTKTNKLTVLALIMAKEYFRSKDMGKSLQWCEKGFKHCPKFKNTSILLKLHYMKSKIYHEFRATEPEFQQIKKCIFFLKALSQSTTENKEFSHELMKSLVKRRDQLKTLLQGTGPGDGYKFQYNKSTQKTSSNALGVQKSLSLNKFRKRSISFTKLKALNEDGSDKQTNNLFNMNLKKSLHKDMASTAYNNMANQAKKDFLKLDINRKTKLKKKGQTLTIWEKNSEKINFENKIAKELQKASASGKAGLNENRLRQLMSRRPNDKRSLNFQTKVDGERGMKINQLEDAQQYQKQKPHFNNPLTNSTSNMPKPQGTKQQSPFTQDQEEPQNQSLNQMKNRVVITTKSDNQLIQYISTIQNEFFSRYFTKSLKASTKKGMDDIDGDYLGDEFLHESDGGGQFSNKDSINKQETNLSKMKGKVTHDYEDRPIEEDSNGSINSYTKNLVVPEEDDEEKMVFPSLVSGQEKKNAIVTQYGVIDQLHLEVRRKKYPLSGRNKKQYQSDGFKFIITAVINNQLHKTQLNFPTFTDPLAQPSAEPNTRFQDEFNMWIYDSAHVNDRRMAKQSRGKEDAGMIQSMLKRQSIDAGIDSFLIEKIVGSLHLRRDLNFGYWKIEQKGEESEMDSDEEWHRENIFEWREKNFQYLKESPVINSKSRTDLLSLDWKFKTTTSKQQLLNKPTQDLSQDPGNFPLFFIQLQKISTSRLSHQLTALQYLITRYNTAYAQIFDKQFVHSYVVYNERRKVEKLREMERNEREVEDGQSFVDMSGLSDGDSFNVLNFSRNLEQKMFGADYRIVAKVEKMRSASVRICSSFFPRSKYLQLANRHIMTEEALNEQKQGKSLSKEQKEQRVIIQSKSSRKFDQFIIKIIGIESNKAHNNKKVSVRKSQIMQLQQNLNHSNFLREVIKSKSSFQVEKQQQLQSATYKKSQFMLKTMGKMSSDGKESVRMSADGSGVGSRLNELAESSKIDELTKSMKRKSLDEQQPKSKISKSSMVRILKKALIQPDYTKSTLLMTYFDSLSIKSFFKLMGTHPNYIKLTCFRLKSIYVEDELSLSYYYLFELQERQARTRMHKFIIGDKEIAKLILQQKQEWMSDNSQRETKQEEKLNIGGNWIVHRVDRQTKTLPQKKKLQITGMDSNDQVLSDENKAPHCPQSVTSSRLKTKHCILQPHFNKIPPMSIGNFSPTQFQLKFTQQSLTQVMKLITPNIVIKKDYLYTSVCIDSNNGRFYLMNRFTVENDSVVGQGGDGKRIAGVGREEISETQRGENDQRSQTFKQCKSEDLYKTNYSKEHDKNYFLTEQIKAKKILCQKSIVLQVTQNFTKSLSKPFKKDKTHGNTPKQKENSNFANLNNNYKETTKANNPCQFNKKSQSLFAILTIIKISKSKYFTIKLYIPKFQRSYTLTLDKSLINYLELKDLKHIFGQVQDAHDILQQLESIWYLNYQQQPQNQVYCGDTQSNPHDVDTADLEQRKNYLLDRLSQMLFQQSPNHQKIYWKNVLSLIKIQEKYTDDKVYLIMKISKFNGFVKDCSFLEFFEKDGKMYMIEMTINKKSQSCQYFPKQQFVESLQGTKIKHGILNQSLQKPKKHTRSHYNAQSYNPSLISAESINCHNEQFVKMSSIYESKAEGYTLYVQIFKIFKEETQTKRLNPLTAKHSISRHFGRINGKNQDEIDSEMIGANDSVNQVVQDSVNMSERQSQVSFSDFKSNNRLNRANTFRNTLKSTLKSITSQTNQKSSPQNCFSRTKRLKSNYKLINPHEAAQPSNDISKINFSFYLSELNALFKYIDENYSEEFNEQYFVLAQMSAAFKMLGTMIVEEFKALRDENVNKVAEVAKKSKRKRVTLLKQKHQEAQAGNKGFKRSVTRKGTNQVQGPQSLMGRQVGFQDSSVNQEIDSDKVSQLHQQAFANKQSAEKTTVNKHQYTVQELFCQHLNQKNFKEKVLGRMREFKEKIDTMVAGDPIREDNMSNLSSRVNEYTVLPGQRTGKAHLSLAQKFISLHNRHSNRSFIDLHILSTQKQQKLCTLFYSYNSLLFLISNTKRFEIFMMSIRVEEEHPFAFIQVLEDKEELACIRNRLFRFYRNLLMVMGK